LSDRRKSNVGGSIMSPLCEDNTSDEHRFSTLNIEGRNHLPENWTNQDPLEHGIWPMHSGNGLLEDAALLWKSRCRVLLHQHSTINRLQKHKDTGLRIERRMGKNATRECEARSSERYRFIRKPSLVISLYYARYDIVSCNFPYERRC